MSNINLILLPDTDHHHIEDFFEIADLIRKKTDNINPYVLTLKQWKKSYLMRLKLIAKPTLVVGMRAFGKSALPYRGACHQGADLSKSETYMLMESAGLAVIPWCSWSSETTIKDWMGSFVISKPDKGARGRSVKVRATSKLKFNIEKHAAEPLILQQFIYTGTFPVVHRVLTLYGEPIMHWRSENRQAAPLLDPNSKHEIAGHNPVASNHSATITLSEDKEIEDFASRVARTAFKNIPLLGFDIIRSATDGSIHVCEVNPYGQTWHFSSRIGIGIQASNNIDFYKQRNAFDTAANILINACRVHAK